MEKRARIVIGWGNELGENFAIANTEGRTQILSFFS